MYVETIYKTDCPECGKQNYISAGDTSDMTGSDPTGVKCWKCGHCYSLDDEDDGEIDPDVCDDGEKQLGQDK